jgi:hypothetical protein
MIGRWFSRVLATVVAVALLGVLAPTLHVSCENAVPCSEWKHGAAAYLAAYVAVLSIPVVLIFLGRGRRGWLGVLGWAMLVCIVLFLLK